MEVCGRYFLYPKVSLQVKGCLSNDLCRKDGSLDKIGEIKRWPNLEAFLIVLDFFYKSTSNLSRHDICQE